jgi:hypothetical protein
MQFRMSLYVSTWSRFSPFQYGKMKRLDFVTRVRVVIVLLVKDGLSRI